jgi:hypothetical protein
MCPGGFYHNPDYGETKSSGAITSLQWFRSRKFHSSSSQMMAADWFKYRVISSDVRDGQVAMEHKFPRGLQSPLLINVPRLLYEYL